MEKNVFVFRNKNTEKNEKPICISQTISKTKVHESSWCEEGEGNITVTLKRTKKQDIQERKIIIPKRKKVKK